MPVCYIFNHKGEKLLRFNATTNKYGSHITIGKSSKCDVCIDHITDASMNNQQLALSSSGRFWYVKDEKDSGKVYKNGKKIKNSVLKPGDFFRFGKLYFGYGEGSGPSNYDLVWETKCKHQKCRVVLWPGCNTIGLAPDNDIIMSNGRDVLNYHAILNVSGDKIFIQRVSKQAEIIVGKEIISKP
ncbi:MAG: FHA domain-containing protein, partial [Lentisphaeria bacterium]